jgi:sulfatase maturation enzyme AslB (radical SAM superfamily)
MFRVVKAFDTGEPGFFLLCDNRQCMEARRGGVRVANSDEYRLSKKEFLKAAMQEGWWIDLEGGFCPAHARDMAHAAQKAQERGQQVVEARPEHVATFGRGRA